MTRQRSTPPVPQRQGPLSDTLVELAGTPDDHSGVGDQLITIARLSAQRVAAVSYASVTARHEGAYSTVAASDAIAVAVDQAQYADQAGPCLDAVDTGRPQSVPDMAVTMRWPGFRDTAYRLGLHTSLSIPLYAGRGEAVAALNLYGHDPVAMATLTAAVWVTYDELGPAILAFPELDAGGAELIGGLTGAIAVRAVIQQAIGIIGVRQRSIPARAYAVLRLRAMDAGTSLVDTAHLVVAEGAD